LRGSSRAAQWDGEARFPNEAMQRMAEAKLLGMTTPEKFRRQRRGFGGARDRIEEIALADASCSLVLSMANFLPVLTLRH
jgi:alkylation response protein AidB-like acyl-CoA dehydrogenase